MESLFVIVIVCAILGRREKSHPLEGARTDVYLNTDEIKSDVFSSNHLSYKVYREMGKDTVAMA